MNFIEQLKHRNPLLYWFGILNLMLFSLFFVSSFFDERTVNEVNVWIKPMKFTFTLWLYSWTFAYILYELPNKRFAKISSLCIVIFMGLENGLIIMQAARGVASHFNQQTVFDGIIFSVMGLLIMLNTITVIAITYKFLKIAKADVFIWGVCIGLIIMILASIEGGYMASKLTHAVNAASNDKGLPFLGWSKTGGDLRIAHFIGIHAFQVFILMGFFLKEYSLKYNLWIILSAGVLYSYIIYYFFDQALKGVSIIY